MSLCLYVSVSLCLCVSVSLRLRLVHCLSGCRVTRVQKRVDQVVWLHWPETRHGASSGPREYRERDSKLASRPSVAALRLEGDFAHRLRRREHWEQRSM
jgi:hypothetical protein